MTSSPFKNKSILITGGSGSFGRAFTKRLLTDDECSKVIIFSRDEWKQWEMQQSDSIFRHSKIRYFLGSVRDLQRLNRAFNEVNIVVHAAALKQVPAAEYNPSEFVQTNVMGAMHIIDAAIDCGVEKVIALSSDKAVNPVNLYGATKLCSDKLFVAGNAYVGARGFPKFSVVRYGNVVGSRGSVVPMWRKMAEEGKGPLPVTDERMTRFWITLDQAIDFVQKCAALMAGGEIFVPKIPSIKITDLAKAIAPHLPITVTGIREGEKLHELMISLDDARHAYEYDSHFTIVPEMWKKRLADRKGKILPDGFVYASDKNTQWLTVEDIKKLLPT